VIVLAALLWFNRYWPEERRVSGSSSPSSRRKFRGRLRHLDERSQLEAASRDLQALLLRQVLSGLGAGGEWGPIHSYKIVGAQKPRPDASGVVIGVRVNQRKELCSVWVEFKDKTLGFSPDEMVE
jgi:hypothetical protein